MAMRTARQETPRLRFDKVATRLVQDVRSALLDSVPDSVCVLFTVTAPIRKRSEITAALVELIRERLVPETALGEQTCVLHGNKVHVRVVARCLPKACGVSGFVHSPGPSPNALLDAAQLLLEGKPVPDVIHKDGATLGRETMQHIGEQLLFSSGSAR